jgi:hypothetical protein
METLRDAIFLAVVAVLAIRLIIEGMTGITIALARRLPVAPRTRPDSADADGSLNDGRWG